MTGSHVDLARLVPAGATVAWGQGPGEPRAFTAALVDQRHAVSGTTVLLGLTLTDTFRPEHADHLRFLGLGGFGANAPLQRAGALRLLPVHMSALVRMIESGSVRLDVVCASVCPPDATGRCSLGAVADYLVPALRAASTRVAEVNPHVPRTFGDTEVRLADFDHVIESEEPLPQRVPPEYDEVDIRLAEHVADLVPDGAVIQIGIGSTLGAVLAALRSKRDLGVHSGLLDDGIVDLVECGAVTGARKPVDRHLTVATMALGSRRVYDFVHDNASVAIRSAGYTHDASALRAFDTFFAVNSALQVDLTGQVNAETLGGAHVGTIGGLVDFSRAATASPHGRSIIAMRSTTRSGTTSRIVPSLADGVTTLARSDVDTVVTEYGVADLRATTLDERVLRLLAVAHPDLRDGLARSIERSC